MQFYRDKTEPLCGACTNGYSETTSDVGLCQKCIDNSGLTIVILPMLRHFVWLISSDNVIVNRHCLITMASVCYQVLLVW